MLYLLSDILLHLVIELPSIESYFKNDTTDVACVTIFFMAG